MAQDVVATSVVLTQDGPQPYTMTDAEAAQLRRRRAGMEAEARKAQAERHQQQLATNATPEALAQHRATAQLYGTGAERQLQRDPIAFLASDGRLRPQQVIAAKEIASVVVAISAGITTRTTASYGERMAKGVPLADWPASLSAAYRDRYTPWRAWAGQQGTRRGSWGRRTSAHTLADLTELLAVDGRAPAVVAEQLRMDVRSVVARLQESLAWYAVRAGWMPPMVGFTLDA